MAIDKHQELSDRVRRGGYAPSGNQQQAAARNIDVLRFAPDQYKVLEEQVRKLLPTLDGTQAGNLGMHVGAQLVLTELRKGFVNGY